jgi:A/G-specific adenine glycosylase
MLISSILKNWYLQNKRDLPWRNTSNPYHIWVSEVILQQTKIIQGLPYYNRFIRVFPDVGSLANAPQEKLLKLWQGLGYYSRALNLQKGAKLVVEKYNGILPADYHQLLSINGIGEYTASAIASIVYNLPIAVVDGNVNRVLARVFGVFDPINQSAGRKKIKQIAAQILDNNNPGMHNQALMDFGALQCVPNNPDCSNCPLSAVCYAFIHHKISELPLKVNNTVVQNRYFYYLVIISQNYIFIRKRIEKDIWHGLFEFPLIETNEKIPVDNLFLLDACTELLGDIPYNIVDAPLFFSHRLSHRNIEACFILLKVKGPLQKLENAYAQIEIHELAKYPVSRLIHKYLEKKDFLTFTIDKP